MSNFTAVNSFRFRWTAELTSEGLGFHDWGPFTVDRIIGNSTDRIGEEELMV
jgi:hypothetical protein